MNVADLLNEIRHAALEWEREANEIDGEIDGEEPIDLDEGEQSRAETLRECAQILKSVIPQSLAVLACLLLLGVALPRTAQAATTAYDGQSWHVYQGVGLLGQRYAASHVIHQTGGKLKLTISQETGGGIAAVTRGLTYGTFAVRMRMSKGSGKPAILLWPDTGKRPEDDFAEGLPTDSLREIISTSWHPDTNPNHTVRHYISINYTMYHTYSVSWTPSGFTYRIDGQVWASDAVQDLEPAHLAVMASWKPGSDRASYIQIVGIAVHQ